MKSRTKMTVVNLILGAAVILLTTACGKIPKAYQGDFVDAATGTTLKLESNEGTLKAADGTELKGKAEDADFDALLDGKPAIYLSTLPGNNVDVFWVVPNLSTRQEREGRVWYVSDIIYMQMNSKQESQVNNLTMFRCKNGQVSLDKSTKEFVPGCPAAPQYFNMVRAGEKKAQATGDSQKIERL